jgi:hypothetical protein
MGRLTHLTLSLALPEQVGYAMCRPGIRDEDNMVVTNAFAGNETIQDVPASKDIKKFVKRSKVL